ncbi:MAG: pantoate--beta-alanine ligase, partial [Yoonia sp.]
VSVNGLTDMLCGAHRPGHFDGVATVVSKLFLQTSADKAFFGEKDYQQLQIVRRMAADLDIPIEVVGCPTIREEDGLAMSSRNLLISDRARVKAPALAEVMNELRTALLAGGRMSDLLEDAKAKIVNAGFNEVEYLDLRDGTDLGLLDQPAEGSRLFAAAWLAGVRLIDNIAV